jgi:hypothetical protein
MVGGNAESPSRLVMKVVLSGVSLAAEMLQLD